ncbi:hypothetical protein Dimus_038488 [Dionaea muscipula]
MAARMRTSARWPPSAWRSSCPVPAVRMEEESLGARGSSLPASCSRIIVIKMMLAARRSSSPLSRSGIAVLLAARQLHARLLAGFTIVALLAARGDGARRLPSFMLCSPFAGIGRCPPCSPARMHARSMLLAARQPHARLLAARRLRARLLAGFIIAAIASPVTLMLVGLVVFATFSPSCSLASHAWRSSVLATPSPCSCPLAAYAWSSLLLREPSSSRSSLCSCMLAARRPILMHGRSVGEGIGSSGSSHYVYI